MFKKLCLLVVWTLTLISCQFTETMIVNEDGSGRISIAMDMSEMMAFGDLAQDSTMVKLDTIIRMKDFLQEKKDSIRQLPKAQQEKLKSIENFNFKTFMDPETKQMFFDIYADFKKVNEVDDLMNAFESSANFLQDGAGGNSDTKINTDESSAGVMAVAFSFDKNTFKRDAYILDKEKHKTQVDSMESAAAFMSSMKYKLKYTFPRKIVKSSVEDARFSLDGKTIEFERSFVDYFRDPDVTDLEVELEN